jgi:hypothetical protein
MNELRLSNTAPSLVKPVRGRPTKNRGLETLVSVVTSLEQGASLAEAATAVGVHASTLRRWRRRDAEFDEEVSHAYWLAQRIKFLKRARRRPHVLIRDDCPWCGACIEVRTVKGHYLRFWRCSSWPNCTWASWRPPSRQPCPTCGGVQYWSHSHKFVHCPSCDSGRPHPGLVCTNAH